MDQLHIEFSHVEIRDILPVQIDHVSVGDPSLSSGCQKAEAFSPRKGALRHQPVIGPVKIPDQGMGEIEGKSSSRGTVQLRAHALVKDSGTVGYLLIEVS